jgi:transcription antitermination factor NusG
MTRGWDMSIFSTRLEKDRLVATGALWYAAHTRHQHEKLVARMLANKGFEVFLPLYTEVRQWRDRMKAVELPLFSCYVFLRGDLDHRLAIITTPGVHGLVSSAGKLAGIPEKEIQAVRSVVEGRIAVEPHPFLKCGDRVRVKSGALSGLEGFLVRKKGQARLVISVSLLERSVAAEVDAATVERVLTSPTKSRTLFAADGPSMPTTRGWHSGGTALVPAPIVWSA